MDKEETQAIAQALTAAEDAFMHSLMDAGYGDYIAITLTAHIVDNNYTTIMEELSYSNVKGMTERRKQ